MTKAEIERIKNAVARVNVKGPANKIIQDLETSILTVEKYRIALEQIYEREGPGLDGSSENESGKIARIALQD